MLANLGVPGVPGGALGLPRKYGWLGLGPLSAFVVVGGAFRVAGHPFTVVGGTLVALGAGVPLFLGRSRVSMVYAVLASAGVVTAANADPRDLAWFALCVLAAWCVFCWGKAVGVAFGAAGVGVLGGEWLFALRDPGWAPWAAGICASMLGFALVRHQLVLVDQLRAAQADLAERSRTEERSRIARELHDVIAHSLTVSLLHVSAARLAIEHDPGDALRALAEAERLGRQSLAEVRATVGLLGSQHPGGVAAPVPGAGQLPELVRQLRDSGADVSLVMEGDSGALPATTGSTVYRIVQEALTNATRHAAGAAVAVRVVAGPGGVELSVDSAGAPGQGSGMGLASMRERAAALGGACSAGPGGRGWLVRASLPVETGKSP